MGQLLQTTTKLFDLTVANGATTSNIASSGGLGTGNAEGISYNLAYGLIVYAPAATEAGVFEVNDKLDGSGTWRVLQDDAGVDIPTPAAGKARLYIQLPYANSFRIKLAGAAGAERVFSIGGVVL